MKHARGLTILASAALLFAVASSPVFAGDDASTKTPALYPNTTRVEPKLDLTSSKDQEKLNAGLAAINTGDIKNAQIQLQQIIDNSKSQYAKALALQGLGNIQYNKGDYKGAIALVQQALAIGVMPNDTYFQLEYELAQMQMAAQEYQPALDTVTKWRAEGKKETAASYALEGNADYRLDKYADAIAAINKAKSLTDKPDPGWNQILLASYAETGQHDKAAALAQQQASVDPTDPVAINNAAAVLVQAHKYPEAIQFLEKARAAGAFKNEANYVTLAKLYVITGQDKDDPAPDANKASAVLQEGMSKGVVKPTADTYVLLGKAAEMANNADAAMADYKKAMPLASNGEPALLAGRLKLGNDEFSQARSLMQQAIDKGVTQKGAAYMMLAQAELGLKNKSAAIAAMKHAAQQPDTAAKAKAWLKKAGAG